RERIRHEVFDAREGAGESDRFEDQRPECVVNRLTRDDFDDAAGDVEPGVVVAPDLTRIGELRQIANLLDETRERLRAAVGCRELAFPSRRMREQMPDEHVAGLAL